MANYNPKFTIEWELRLCDVDGRPGYFHTWEHYSRPIIDIPSGIKPTGFVSGVYGIVEFSDGVKRVEPDHIKFFDEQHSILCEWEKNWKEFMKHNNTDMKKEDHSD